MMTMIRLCSVESINSIIVIIVSTCYFLLDQIIGLLIHPIFTHLTVSYFWTPDGSQKALYFAAVFFSFFLLVAKSIQNVGISDELDNPGI